MSNENGARSQKKSVLITVNSELHLWAKQNIKNFSGFVEKSLADFSASVSADKSKPE